MSVYNPIIQGVLDSTCSINIITSTVLLYEQQLLALASACDTVSSPLSTSSPFHVSELGSPTPKNKNEQMWAHLRRPVIHPDPPEMKCLVEIECTIYVFTKAERTEDVGEVDGFHWMFL